MRHRFKKTCYEPGALLSGCDTLKKFMKRLSVQSLQDPDSWDPMVYRGDGFEALIEILIINSPIDKRINIRDYEPWDAKKHGRDSGVDGLGLSHDGSPHTVQIKFRSNVAEELTPNKDMISNFVAKSLSMYPGQQINMTIFTTANDLLESVNQDMYHGQVRTLGYKELSKLIDKNLAFWDVMRKEMGV
jgi:hypothetical protein